MATRTYRLRIVVIDPQAPAGRCRVLEDGVPCGREIDQRGLCNKHRNWAKANGRLEELGLPATKGPQRALLVLKPVDEQEPGICRIIWNGMPCTAPAERRGLCQRHYGAIHQRPDLAMDDFAAPRRQRTIVRRRKIIEGACRAEENGIPCTDPVRARGLCAKHYTWLAKNDPAGFVAIAVPEPRSAVLTLRLRPRPGRCRVAEDGQGCGEKSARRGLCNRHLIALRKAGRLEEIALAPKTRLSQRVLTRSAAPLPGTCLVIEDGQACTMVATHRGLCHHHRRMIHGLKAYRVEDFYLPEREPVVAVKVGAMALDGLCRVVEDGTPCGAPPYRRGLCRPHYRQAERLGRLEALALPVGEKQPRYGPGNDVPHVYLDKNILFDACDQAAYGQGGQEASVRLVSSVRTGQVRATVSVDALKCGYNHVRYRAQRTAELSGHAVEASAAEALAQKTMRELLGGSTALWRFAVLPATAWLACLQAGGTALSLEDAIEWATWQQERAKRGGPTWFVTRDAGIPGGVHPAHVARTLGLPG